MRRPAAPGSSARDHAGCPTTELITWGFWGLFPTLAVQHISPSALVYEAVSAGVWWVLLAALSAGWPEFAPRGALFAGLTGVTAIVGGWFHLYAARAAAISTVVVITALYPVVTVVLAMTLLREAISWRQFLAVILAIVAIVLIATEPAHRAGAVSPTA